MKWRSRALYLKQGVSAAEQHVAFAYRDLFNKPGEQQEIVLADLADYTGYYRVEPPGADLTAYQAAYSAGLRAAFGRVLHFLSLTDEQLAALEEAARRESEID
jgi:hypothetical protein